VNTQTKDQTFSDYVATLKRRWRPASLVGGALFLICVAIAFSLPAIYESSATILIEQKKIPDEMIHSTVASYAETLLESVQQRVMATENIVAIIKKHKLYDEKTRAEDINALVDEFHLSTVLLPAVAPQVQPGSGRTAEVTYAFTVSFQYPDPALAQAVVGELANLYTRANESLRTETAANTTSFLDAEAARLQRQLAETQLKLGQLKSKYGVQIADNPALNLSRFEQTEREMMQVEQELRSARERRDLLQTDITRTPRYRPVVDDSGQTMLAGSDRLAQAQQELIVARGRYSDDHPDVVRLRREIAALSGGPVDQSGEASQIAGEIAVRQQELAAARQTYSDSHPDVVRLQTTIANLQKQLKDAAAKRSAPASMPAATNPDYLQLVTRMRSADEEISTATRRRADLAARLDEYRHGLFPSPEAEREYTDLSREYEFLQTQFSEIRTKQSQATLAQKLEAGQRGERLTVVNPPRLPTTPVKPNRLMLGFLGLVLALAGALGTAALTEAMDKLVRGQKDVYALMGDAPLAIIPYIQNSADTRRRSKKNTVMAASAAGAVAIVMMIIML
jgi:uncharacterized protein involved in exopolysaccharide biosynthesis